MGGKWDAALTASKDYFVWWFIGGNLEPVYIFNQVSSLFNYMT